MSSDPSGLYRASTQDSSGSSSIVSCRTPATRILPSGWTTTSSASERMPPKLVSTDPALFGPNVSSMEPLRLSRPTMNWLFSVPTTTVLPSGWAATAVSSNPNTVDCPFVPKVGSSAPPLNSVRDSRVSTGQPGCVRWRNMVSSCVVWPPHESYPAHPADPADLERVRPEQGNPSHATNPMRDPPPPRERGDKKFAYVDRVMVLLEVTSLHSAGL